MAITLKSLNTSAKLGISFFLLSISIGTISALIMLGLQLSHQESGFVVPSIESIKLHYHDAQIVAAMKTSMNQYVADADDIVAVEKWIASGRSEEAYAKDIEPIISNQCASCHNPNATMSGAMRGLPLTSYKEVLSHTDAGYSWVKQSKQAHVHLFGIGTFMAVVTLIFAFTSLRPWVRNTLITAAWVALILDVLCWWLTKYEVRFAYVIVGAGATMSGSAITMCGLAILDTWVRVPLLTAPAAPASATPAAG